MFHYDLPLSKEGCMSVAYLFEKVGELKEKFKSFFTQKKKLKALENYSEVAHFPHKGYLPLIKKCMNDGFLGDTEANFLGHLLDKYEINFLDWSHKTKWLKGEMNRIRKQNPEKAEEQLTLFNFEKVREESRFKVPFEVVAQKQKQYRERRV